MGASRKTLTLIVTALFALAALVGCSSDSTSPTGTTIDTAPPAVPSDLSGQSWDGAVVLNWAPNTSDADFAGFRVYRVNGDRRATLVSTPMPQNWYVDQHPLVGVENVYEVTAVDLSGNESAYTTVTVAVDPTFGPYQPANP